MKDFSVAAKGLEGVIVGDTALSRVDGEKGELVYLGYDIDQLASCSFEQVAYLFLFRELPNTEQLEKFENKLRNNYAIPDNIQNFIVNNAKKDHPMAILRTAVSLLSSHQKEASVASPEEMRTTALNLIAKTAAITATIARVRQNKDPLAPNVSYNFCKNFLYMCFGESPEDIIIKTLDTAMILHVDHSFNASTFTARVVTSSLSDMISAVVAAIGSLKGPLHGGANTAVMKMLKEIGEIENIETWLDKALSEKRKIMGFGHRVYKTVDPRAKHLKKMSKEWGDRAQEKKWFRMSEKLEQLMLEKKNINPNVDFYSASTYYTMGFEPDMYTPIFAVARMVGWCAHIMEQLHDNRIMRPRANYVGPEGLKYKTDT